MSDIFVKILVKSKFKHCSGKPITGFNYICSHKSVNRHRMNCLDKVQRIIKRDSLQRLYTSLLRIMLVA